MSEEKNPLREFIEHIAPQCEQLQEDEEGTLFTNIVDEELDPFKVVFNGDDCATIRTDNMQYIVLSQDLLYSLIDLISEAHFEYEDRKETEN